ncbi:DinB family protein [Hymenobacter persicinus]|uniref:DinB family protein n=1 Tax=Hymenobacter persicinus TaxID=2025506 RepID=A0A4Q5LFV0_9BACT|nr:DinB family protein [Hymenobacter persicinus]RYU84337.1 DinB family protein [Hymenobacter persicinus]
MTELSRLTDQLTRAFDGDTWSGPSLLTTLRGVDAVRAARRPIPGAHSIWELVLHLTTWINVVHERVVTGLEVPVPDALDWPAVPEAATAAAWEQARQALVQAQSRLLTQLPTLTDEELEQTVGAPGTDVTRYVLLHGLAQHNLYHAGQIALLRKAGGE